MDFPLAFFAGTAAEPVPLNGSEPVILVDIYLPAIVR